MITLYLQIMHNKLLGLSIYLDQICNINIISTLIFIYLLFQKVKYMLRGIMKEPQIGMISVVALML